MGGATNRVDRIAALCGMIWFIFIIDACFTWFIENSVFRSVIGSFFVFFATFFLQGKNGLIISKQRHILSAPLLVLALFMVVVKTNVFQIFRYLPLICVVYWRESVLSQMYCYFRKFVLFYCIISLFAEILVFSRMWISLPHILLPPQDYIQEHSGLVNYYYGLFCIPAPDTSLSFYRACGPLREGGHWILFIGFVYFTEKALRGKRNIWLIICGILTLSPNFILILLLTEIYCAIKQKKIFRPLLNIVGIFGVIVILFLIAPQYIKDNIIGIFYERILERSLQSVEDEGWMAFLDGRATEYSFMEYDSFLHSDRHTRLFGVSPFDAENIMSDFRYLFMYVGFVGTTLIALCTLVFSFKKPRNLFNVCIFLWVFAFFMQRAWMFNEVYIWAMILFVTNQQLDYSNRKNLCIWQKSKALNPCDEY